MENRQKQINVLLVEDEPGDQKLVRTAIYSRNPEVNLKTVSSAEEAIDYLQLCTAEPQKYARPGLILLDLNMPGMGGREFLKLIKSDDDLCSIPVVIVTTSDFESDIETCYTKHAAGYVQKSASPEEFADVLQKLARYWFSTTMTL
jgi:CheY-like chemotaxis protein